MSIIMPDDPNALLQRVPTAAALTAAGYPVSPKTLATKATRDGGPSYRLFGRRALYRWGDALAWAQDQMSAPRASTSGSDITHTATARSMSRAVLGRHRQRSDKRQSREPDERPENN